MTGPVFNEARLKIAAAAVRTVVKAHPLLNASREEVRTYEQVLNSRAIEAMIEAEPKWDRGRGTKAAFLFRVAMNKATDLAKRYDRPGLRGDELEDDRTHGSVSTPHEQLELHEDVIEARSWRAAWAARMAEIAGEKPRYALALEAFRSKHELGHGFIEAFAAREGLERDEVEKAMRAFKKRLQRDELLMSLVHSAPESGLLAALDDAQQLEDGAEPERTPKDDHADADAEREDQRGAGAGPRLAPAAAGLPGPAELPPAGGARGPERAEERPPMGQGCRRAPAATWLTFPTAPGPRCRPLSALPALHPARRPPGQTWAAPLPEGHAGWPAGSTLVQLKAASRHRHPALCPARAAPS